ncbi:chromate transporter [Effusibacillus lacus]|uniref:Chromate transporter n=1 Tax=Effusibacillus lacus TaxID=1348429 RepID=A0A292YPM4_9BACL|nr:chromate transporter [Effusibacillus lacus]TCS76533.1 chromate transporter [Effusibacillus lacus]GAX90445.1 chromate transporter [Effusibacillus lacus]
MSEPIKKSDTAVQLQDATYSLWQLVLYFLKLGTIGFGGPVALVGYMFRDLVEKRRWISESDYKDGLALSQLAPGPLAAQLGFYLGYVHYSVLGATLVGIAFVLPSFLMVVALGWAYAAFGGLTWMQAVFYAVGASVIGIIAFSAYKLTSKTIGKDWLLWAIFLVVAVYTVVTETEEVIMFLAAGILYWLVKAPPKGLKWRNMGFIGLAEPAKNALGAVQATDSGTLWNIFTFFTKAGAFVFGSGLAIVPFLFSGVVKEYQWLTDHQFLDAVAVAMITPGPVVITTGFIGYLVAGFPGASIAALATFLPAYLLTIIPAPFFKKYGKRPGINAFVTGVTAAATGAITGAVIVLGKRSLVDVPTVSFALATLLLLWKSKKVSEPIIVLAASIIGLIVYPITH